jgi:hypothetical protein
VPLVPRHEHGVARALLDVGVPDTCQTLALDEVLRLFGVRVPMWMMLGARLEDGQPDDVVFGAHGVARDDPSHRHAGLVVTPPGIGVERHVDWDVRQPQLHRMLVH